MTLQDNGQYTITLDEILNNSEITEVDLTELYDDKLDYHLLNASNKVYNVLYSAAPGFYRKNNRLAINYLIQNDTDKQAAIREAIIEFIRGALYSGMDLREYTEQTKHYSDSIMHILKENDLWVVSKIEYQDEDIA
jgi:hypothetical protein